MKKILLLAAAFIAISAFTSLSHIWRSDPPNSQLGFTVTYLGILDISGIFNDFKITVKTEKPDFSDAYFELSARVASIDTRLEERDDLLKTADFFDAEQYPTLTFESKSIKSTGKNKYKLTGDLTLHGITKSVTMDLLYRGTTENPGSKKQTAGFLITGSINRSDFGIATKYPSPILSEQIQINIDSEFIQNGK